MTPTFRLGRVRGIELAANWSVLVIAGLLTWGLAVNVLPVADPDQPAAAYWIVALGAALCFFAALLAHELSHSLVARRHGVEVRQITLWLLGGVSQLEGASPTARAELQIAVVGPLTSLALGAVAGGLALLSGLSPALDLLSGALWWLALINVVLGVFNLVPAFPLDGGRILRAALWVHWEDEDRATAAAARAGRGFGLVLVAGGLALLVFGQPLDGIWFALIGWFLVTASASEAQATGHRHALRGATVDTVMTSNPVVVAGSTPVAALIDAYLLGRPHSAYPVVGDGGRLVGLVSLDDVRRLPAERRGTTTVDAIAQRLDQVVVCHPQDPAAGLVDQLRRTGASRALVVDSGHLVGLVTQADLVAAMAPRHPEALGREALRQAFRPGAR